MDEVDVYKITEVDVYKIAIDVLRDTINYQNEDVDNSYVSGIIDMTDRMIEHIAENEIVKRNQIGLS